MNEQLANYVENRQKEVAEKIITQLGKLQDYIDKNSIYRIEFGHYEGIKWIPLKTHRINVTEVLNAINNGFGETI